MNKYGTDQCLLVASMLITLAWMIMYTFTGFPFILPLVISEAIQAYVIVRLAGK